MAKKAKPRTGELLAIAVAGDPVLSFIRSGRAQTRAELTSLTGLSRSTVSSRVDLLMDAGLVTVEDQGQATGGRPAARLRFNGAAGVILAADLGASRAHLALMDMNRRVLVEKIEDWKIAAGPETTLAWLKEQFDELAGSAPNAARPLGVGIGLPGPVEFATGEPVSPPLMPGWDRFPIRPTVETLFGLPVWVDNDVNLRALGEWTLRWPSISELLFVKAATGIGAGIVSNGRITRGAQGSAGDIGHIPVAGGQAVPCACGNYGCLEAVAGGRAIAARLSQQGIPTGSPADVVQHVRAGVPEAVVAIRDAGREIGQVLAGLVNTLNPSVVVVGGALAEAGDALLAGIREVIYQRCPPLATRDLKILSSDQDSSAGIVGAATLVLEAAPTGLARPPRV